MSHTPLGSFLKSMARQAKLMRRTGESPAEFDATRRAFLSGSVGLVGTAALRPLHQSTNSASKSINRAEAPSTEPEPSEAGDAGDAARLRRKRVVIIGAGLGGLTCAYELKKRGINAEVWEASNRLGGRCLSDHTSFGPQVIERGGELIDTGHVAITALVAELGLQLDDLRAASAPNTPSFFFDGKPYTIADATRDYAGVVYDHVQADSEAAGYPVTYLTANDAARQLDRLSTRQWINSRVPGGVRSKLGRLLDIAYTIEYGLSTSEQSSLTLLGLLSDSTQEEFTEFGASDERFKVRGGNDQVVSKLAAQLGGRVTTNVTLTGIRKTSSGDYRLGVKRGGRESTEIASHVILALPFSILRERVDYQRAGFKPLKLRAIRELRYGANSKLHVETNGRPWSEVGIDGSTYADTGYQATWESTRAQAGSNGIIVNFTGAEYAETFAFGPPSARARLFAAQFEPVVPGFSRRLTGRATVDAWSTNPFSLGSYSAWKVGQVTTWAGVEGEPEGNVFFCGEHTSIENQGYLEGAVETGQRAATEVAAALA
jgi:monoamine oxidase